MAAGVARRDFLLGLGVSAAAILHPLKGEAAAWKADRVIVVKSRRRLYLLAGPRILASHPVALGSHPIGRKLERGDGRTPEGNYVIDGRNPDSPYFLALHISYPNAEDLARSRAAGVDPGGDICIHGLPHGFERLDPVAFNRDWTEGCIAVSDHSVVDVWLRVDDGTPILIRP